VAGNIEIRKIDEASQRELQQREDSNWKAWQEGRTDKDRRREEQDKDKERQQRQ
jgi:hypothetical protein